MRAPESVEQAGNILSSESGRVKTIGGCNICGRGAMRELDGLTCSGHASTRWLSMFITRRRRVECCACVCSCRIFPRP